MKWLLIFPILFLLNGCTKPRQVLCEQTGGKWASVDAQCIRPSCAKPKTCGTWANPAKWCDKVKIGDNKESVRFWLGEPNSERGNIMQWTAYKAENDKITAEFDNNVLTKFQCPNQR